MWTKPWYVFGTAALAVVMLAVSVTLSAAAATVPLDRVDAISGAGSTTPIAHWDIQSAAKAQQSGQDISVPGYSTKGRYATSAHATVMAGLLENGTYPNIFYGNNLEKVQVPDTDHHRFLLTKMLTRIDALTADIADVETQIEAQIAPFAPAVARLDEIPGVGAIAAAVIIAEVGVDMTRFPTPAHLSSWARFAPGVKESAGRKKGTGSTGHGDRYLARVLGEAAVGASRTNTFLGERYRRIARRRGKKKAVVAVGRSILVIAWHLLHDENATFYDLGPGYYDSRTNPESKKRNHIRQLEALGYKVTLQPAA